MDGEPRHTDVRVGGIAGGIRCESDSAYFRILEPDRGLYASPVYRVRSDGTSVQFTTSRIPDAKDAELIAFDVNSEGGLIAIVRDFRDRKPDVSLVQFSASGQYVSRVHLQTDLDPLSIALLPLNELLVELTSYSSLPTQKRVTAIFSESGEIVRILNLENDPRDSPSRRAGLGAAQVGHDGHIYQFSGGTAPTLTRYDFTGKPLRTVRLELPFKGAAAMDFLLGAQRLLVIFQTEESLKGEGSFRMVYSLYDIVSGRRIVDYSKLPGPIACFTDEEITVLTGTKDGYFAIGKASLK